MPVYYQVVIARVLLRVVIAGVLLIVVRRDITGVISQKN